MAAEIVNALTGECRITDDERGTDVYVVFTLEAIAHVERMPGAPGVLDLVSKGRFSVTETLQLIAAGSEAYRRRNPGSQRQLSEKAVFRLIAGAGGLPVINPPLLESLIKAEGLGLRDEVSSGDEDEPDVDEDIDDEEDDDEAPLGARSTRPAKRASRSSTPGA